ncbi:hypothetical protein ppKF707_6069 [Metapseudomonas furukawaii]|nr:hypothetical protein ppKF707_6069 [Pseudomonas furukawaii]
MSVRPCSGRFGEACTAPRFRWIPLRRETPYTRRSGSLNIGIP